MTDGRLLGKVAVISGAARGQGLAIANLFHAHGCRIVLGDIIDGEPVARSLGEGAIFHPLDVTSDKQWQDVVDCATNKFKRLDILVNNAGMIRYRPLAETSNEEYFEQFQVDQMGVFLGMRSAYPALRAAQGGSIINTSSTAGLLGLPMMGAYGAAKQAVCAMTRTAAAEWGKFNIRVNNIIPGAIRTTMLTDYVTDGDIADVARASALNRVGEPEDIANLALFLASDESSFCTGSDFFCDGGFHILK